MPKIAVITISDRASRGEYADRSGPAILALLKQRRPDCTFAYTLIADDPEAITAALENQRASDLILTTGGTGIGPRDHTPEASRRFCRYELPGLAEWLRAQSLTQTPHAVFSRGICGVADPHSLVVNLPGSLSGALFYVEQLLTVLDHGWAMLHGHGH